MQPTTPLHTRVCQSNAQNSALARSFYAIKKRAACALSISFLMGLSMLTGCATGPNANPRDPLEPLNRSISAFNEVGDRAVIRPIAQAYVAVTPQPVRKGVANFFDNLEDAWSFVNSTLQLRGEQAGNNFFRVVLNTFFGLGGLLNVADEANITRHPQDLGKTLGRWGVPPGPYVVLPFFGPSTLRDSLTIVAESQANLVGKIEAHSVRDSLSVLRLVDTRAGFLKLDGFLDDAALDKYTFTRDAFLQRRSASITGEAEAADKDEDFSKPAKDAKK